jgi:hypothetical protein
VSSRINPTVMNSPLPRGDPRMLLTSFAYLNDALIYLISLGAVLVLFGSLIGLAIWVPRLVWYGLLRLLP